MSPALYQQVVPAPWESDVPLTENPDWSSPVAVATKGSAVWFSRGVPHCEVLVSNLQGVWVCFIHLRKNSSVSNWCVPVNRIVDEEDDDDCKLLDTQYQCASHARGPSMLSRRHSINNKAPQNMYWCPSHKLSCGILIRYQCITVKQVRNLSSCHFKPNIHRAEGPFMLLSTPPPTLSPPTPPPTHSRLSLEGCRLVHYLHQLSGPDLREKSVGVITLNVPSVCYTSDHSSMFQKADDIQWNASRAQPYSGAEPSMARIHLRMGKRTQHPMLSQEIFAGVNSHNIFLKQFCLLRPVHRS